MRRFLTPAEFPGVGDLARCALVDLPNLADNRGRGAAPLVWMCLLSHLKWSSRRRSVYLSNERIARMTGLGLRAVEWAISWLRRAGRIETGWSPCRGRYGPGRIVRLSIAKGPAPRVIFPPWPVMREIWRRCRELRERVGHMVNLAVAAFVHAAAEHGAVAKRKVSQSRVGDLARFIGAKRGGTFSGWLRDLEGAGILRRRAKTWAGGFVVFARTGIDRIRELAREAEAAVECFVHWATDGPLAGRRDADPVQLDWIDDLPSGAWAEAPEQDEGIAELRPRSRAPDLALPPAPMLRIRQRERDEMRPLIAPRPRECWRTEVERLPA